ncbi:putative protein N(5)-glutamine methyltransferase [Streptomyces sp. RFCAC02]|uniref:putative protein N(5)-glutamine methyltransferase n=1 Tax=Streptomyces sp. RFCAC02 TaxID=2499143 RepID=UPI00102069C3|nr:putative protein N(5)-glutamine methyltransferase [Streptomyces sp. RFCAC02]
MQDPHIIALLRAAGCVFAEDEARLLADAARSPAELTALAERRATGVPLEQVVGWAEFAGLRITVEPGVFVPRRRTEALVAEALVAEAVRRAPARPVVVDLCCGSGAIGAALAAALDPAELHAADIDPVAVRCARRNLAPAGGTVHRGDLFDALPARLRGRVDILTANVPYVPTDAVPLLPPEAREHEPIDALDGGPDGLGVLRRVSARAAGWLAPGGVLLSETGERQADRAARILAGDGLVPRIVHDEDTGATVVTGRRPRTVPEPPAPPDRPSA